LFLCFVAASKTRQNRIKFDLLNLISLYIFIVNKPFIFGHQTTISSFLISFNNLIFYLVLILVFFI
jgi:hypothetical protein